VVASAGPAQAESGVSEDAAPAAVSAKKPTVSEDAEEDTVAVSGTDRLLAVLACAFSVASAVLSWVAYQAVQP
jgi:hypothetical protein